MKKRSRGIISIFVTILVILIVFFAVRIYLNNSKVDSVLNENAGTFQSETIDLHAEDAFNITLYDEGMDTDYYLKEWDIKLDSKEKNFAYMKGSAVNGDYIITGTWQREKNGDYTLYSNGEIFAYIIVKQDSSHIKKEMPKFVLVILSNREKYLMNKLNDGSLLYYNKA